MRPALSEFSYGYALTEDLINSLGPGLTAAPVFPSLSQEGRVGYDLSLSYANFALFLQFKLSDEMGPRATEAKNGILASPYYRMHLWRRQRSQQHELLVSLSELGESVFYAAPAFCSVLALNSAYLTKKVAYYSAFFDPKDIGRLPDDDEHYVAFSMRPKKAFFCSEPHEMQFTPGTELADSLHRHILNHARKQVRTDILAEQINEQLLRVLSEQAQVDHVTEFDQVRPQPPLASALYLSRSYFGCELYFVSQLGS